MKTKKHVNKSEHSAKSYAGKESVKGQGSRSSEKSVPGKYYPLISGAIILVLLALVIFLFLRNPSAPNGSDYSGEKVKVEFYIMSQCPYGTQVEDAIAPVLEQMGGAVDFRLDYIARETAPLVFDSLHGEKEVKGNIVQLCAKSYAPDKYMKFIVCQNKDAANVDTNWQACAQEVGIDAAKLKSCLESDEGKNLLKDSLLKTQVRGATGSPTIYINDVAYQGARDSLSFQRAICKYSEHPSCAAIPECASDDDCTEFADKEGYCINPGADDAKCEYKDPVAFEYIILNDKKCVNCDTTKIVQVMQQLFLGSKARLVDVSSEEGKVLVEKYSLEVVPVYISDAAITQTKSWNTLEGLDTAFDKLSDGKYRLKDEVTGANYFVSEEARKEYYEAIDVVKGDNKPQIDFFIMSYCPYGNQAEEGIEPAYQLLKDKAIFNPRYVIYENYGGGGPDYCLDSGKLCSMHGIQELNQNIREACVNKYFGIDKWFEFALEMNAKCNYQNADTCWEAVAEGLKLDTAKIKDCQEKEGIAMMAADKELGNKLGVSGSPTVFVDGDPYGGGRTPEAYKTGLCAAFENQPAECSKTLEGGSAAPASGSC